MNNKIAFQYINGLIPEMDNLCLQGHFFNSFQYLSTKDFAAVRLFIAKDSEGRIYARMVFIRNDDAWVSLPESPYGGIDYHPEMDINGFLQYVVKNFAFDEQLHVKLPSDCLVNLKGHFKKAGFTLLFEDLNHHFDLSKPWKPHLMEQRRIEKCEDAGFLFERLLPTRLLIAKVHGFIAQCREENGLEINIDFSSLLHQIEQNPDHYDIYVIKHGEAIIAATITVRINLDIVYNYLPASLKSYNSYSPMTMLLKNVFMTYQRKNFRILDLGISSIEGKKQKGLASFKKAMGAIESGKSTMMLNGQQ